MVLTNTFGATRLRLAHSGLETFTRRINERAALLARKAGVRVAGSVGPTGELLEPHGSLARRECVREFVVQAWYLAPFVDMVVLETFFDLEEARCALEGVREAAPDVPVVLSLSFDSGGRTMFGVSPSEAAEFARAEGLLAVGANCGAGLDEFDLVVEELCASGGPPVWAKPNAGVPHVTAEGVVYPVDPVEFAEHAERWVEAGAAYVGGCCGSTPAHLEAVAGLVAVA